MVKCYLGLGSNLACPPRQIRQAQQSLRKTPRTRFVKLSTLHQTAPMGMRYQPTYANAVLAIQTTLPPKKLLAYCQAIEKKQGRHRKHHWGPRTLDIDILIYGALSLKTRLLHLPHPEMQHRAFVMMPLLEVLCDEYAATAYPCLNFIAESGRYNPFSLTMASTPGDIPGGGVSVPSSA